MSAEFIVSGTNAKAPFHLKIYRGDGMALLGMNWKKGKPPKDFVGFAIELKAPNSTKFISLSNRIAFPGTDGAVNPKKLSSRLSPIQKFRWVNFPFNAELKGKFVYRVTPVFMDKDDVLSYGEPQEAGIELRRETFPGLLNVTFTRGFVSSQAFVDRFGGNDSIPLLLPGKAKEGLTFVPTFVKPENAYKWMGFEARSAILELLDEGIADKKAQVRAVLYDLNEPGIVTRLEKLGKRVKVIIDDDGEHGEAHSGESQAAKRLRKTAGSKNVKRQHMGKLQHNKIVVVDGPKVKAAVCGSTNHSWRGFFVQNNNAIVVRGEQPTKVFMDAFEDYWNNDTVKAFGKTKSASFNKLELDGIDIQICFSPLSKENSVLQSIGDDVSKNTTSSLFFSLAFLSITPGAIKNALMKVKEDNKIFSYGIADKKVKGLSETKVPLLGVAVHKPDGSISVVNAEALREAPEPFKSEPTGGAGTRMHHKFIVIDFDKPTGRVYMGSYNFSASADKSNGENLLLIRDQRVAVSYMVEAVRLFDHYHFRVAQLDKKSAKKKLQLAKPPRKPGEKPWWMEDYTDPRKILDRQLFA